MFLSSNVTKDEAYIKVYKSEMFCKFIFPQYLSICFMIFYCRIKLCMNEIKCEEFNQLSVYLANYLIKT